ncbi:MAG: hypothetical protein ABI658_31770 [Acidimicrobiales bacterium]
MSVVSVTATPPGVSRLAFADGAQMYVLRGDGQPIAVGPEGKPVWSGDGRYLAWSRDERVRAGVGVANEPGERSAYLLDTVTGQRIRFQDRTHPLEGTVLSLGDGFAAIGSGKNNLGNATTDFLLLRPAELATGRLPELVHPTFALDGKPTDYDFAWVDARGGRLYVVITGASMTGYRYSPQLWEVSLDGSARRLFDDCTAAAQCGLSNAGYRTVSVSPDGRHIAYETGTRVGGCDVYFSLGLRASASGDPILLEGLPQTEARDGGTRSMVRAIRWISNNEFLIDLRTSAVAVTYPRGPQCDESQVLRRLFRCSIKGSCVDLGTVTTAQIESRAGDIVEVQAPLVGQFVSSVEVTWTGGARQQISVSSNGADLAWAP